MTHLKNNLLNHSELICLIDSYDTTKIKNWFLWQKLLELNSNDALFL